MRSIRRADTSPELALRSRLHRRGWRFRKDHLLRANGLRVKADLVFAGARLAVFVDGCFWHGCPDHGRQPKVNTHYWGPKLERIAARDRQVTAALEADGWRVLRIWEHVPLEDAVAAVERLLEAPSAV